jgi:hypothetical protein
MAKVTAKESFWVGTKSGVPFQVVEGQMYDEGDEAVTGREQLFEGATVKKPAAKKAAVKKPAVKKAAAKKPPAAKKPAVKKTVATEPSPKEPTAWPTTTFTAGPTYSGEKT